MFRTPLKVQVARFDIFQVQRRLGESGQGPQDPIDSPSGFRILRVGFPIVLKVFGCLKVLGCQFRSELG